MASFSNAAFGQDTAFSSLAWDFDGAPPPPPPPTPNTPGFLGTPPGRTRRDDDRELDWRTLEQPRPLVAPQDAVAEIAADAVIADADREQGLSLFTRELDRRGIEPTAELVALYEALILQGRAEAAKRAAIAAEDEAISMLLVALLLDE